MLRDLDRLTGRTFDVLVVGGGIYGLTIAYDAAERGLSVALIEADDFGSGASFNHLRTIHGGLRYLQSLDLARARESIGERRTLARIAPHAVRPLAFALPIPRSLARGPLAMRAGFRVDRVIARDRNRDLPASLHLPGGSVLSGDEARRRFADLDISGPVAVWYDYETVEADRLTFAWALAAAAHGAILANHLEAGTLLVAESGGKRRVSGVRARDRLSNQTLDIASQVTVNAAGGAAGGLLSPLGLADRAPLLKAMNLVTSRSGREPATGARAPSGRNLFAVPWRGRLLFGTWESHRPEPPGATAVEETDVSAFLAELNRAFPSLHLDRGEVTLVHRGLVPADVDADGRVCLRKHERIEDASTAGIEGLVTVAGTKYTTARAVAERVTNLLAAKLQRTLPPCRTATTPLPGGDLADVAAAVAEARRDRPPGMSPETAAYLVACYGSGFRDVLQLAAGRRDWAEPVASESPVIGAALVWAARQEMALTLCDAVVRRTPLGALGHPGEAAAERAARLLADELAWSSERIAEELASLRRFYRVGGSG